MEIKGISGGLSQGKAGLSSLTVIEITILFFANAKVGRIGLCIFGVQSNPDCRWIIYERVYQDFHFKLLLFCALHKSSKNRLEFCQLLLRTKPLGSHHSLLLLWLTPLA